MTVRQDERMRKAYVVMNATGLVFAGVSTISGRPMWIDCCGDLSHASDVEALRFRRVPAWLKLAQRYDVTAEWKEL
jgi:hypothetical protein